MQGVARLLSLVAASVRGGGGGCLGYVAASAEKLREALLALAARGTRRRLGPRPRRRALVALEQALRLPGAGIATPAHS